MPIELRIQFTVMVRRGNADVDTITCALDWVQNAFGKCACQFFHVAYGSKGFSLEAKSDK